MSERFYIQTCALPDLCSRCGDYDKVAEVRTLMNDRVMARLCLDCLEGSEYL